MVNIHDDDIVTTVSRIMKRLNLSMACNAAINSYNNIATCKFLVPSLDIHSIRQQIIHFPKKDIHECTHACTHAHGRLADHWKTCGSLQCIMEKLCKACNHGEPWRYIAETLQTTERLADHCGPLRCITETLWRLADHCRPWQYIAETLWKACGPLEGLQITADH